MGKVTVRADRWVISSQVPQAGKGSETRWVRVFPRRKAQGIVHPLSKEKLQRIGPARSKAGDCEQSQGIGTTGMKLRQKRPRQAHSSQGASLVLLQPKRVLAAAKGDTPGCGELSTSPWYQARAVAPSSGACVGQAGNNPRNRDNPQSTRQRLSDSTLAKVWVHLRW